MRCTWLAMLELGLLGGAFARADLALISPALGRPAIVAPGDRFPVILDDPDAAITSVELVGAAPGQRYSLQPVESAAPGAALFEASATTPQGVFDLHVTTAAGSATAAHAVAIRHLDDAIRVVHLSDFALGDLNTPEPEWGLVGELNLLGADVFVLTGDYVDPVHPDPPRGWRQLREFLANLNAPVIAACGDRDELGPFSAHLAASPIGQVEVGPLRVATLFDLPPRPLTDDAPQLEWLRELTSAETVAKPLLLIGHRAPGPSRSAACLAFDLPPTTVVDWICGGWHGLGPLGADAVVVTPPATTFQAGQPSGAAHYRVLDYAISPDGTARRSSNWPTPVAGRSLQLRFDDSNDGGQSHVVARVWNRLPYAAQRLFVQIDVKKSDLPRPRIVGGEITALADHGGFWRCDVRFDVPARATAGVLVTTDGQNPDEPIGVDGELAKAWTAARAADDASAADGEVAAVSVTQSDGGTLELTNPGATERTLTPIVMVDGALVRYALDQPGARPALGYRLRLGATERITLRLAPRGLHLRPGRHEVCVYPEGHDTLQPERLAVEVTRTESSPQVARP